MSYRVENKIRLTPCTDPQLSKCHELYRNTESEGRGGVGDL